MYDENKKNSEAYDDAGELLYDAGRIGKEASDLYCKFSDENPSGCGQNPQDAGKTGIAVSGKEGMANNGVASSGSEGAVAKTGGEGGKALAQTAGNAAEGTAEKAGESAASNFVSLKLKLIVLGVIILSLLCMVLTAGTTSQSQFQGVFHLTAKGDDAYSPQSDDEIHYSLYDRDAAKKDTSDLIDIIIKVKAENYEKTITELKNRLKENNWDVGRSMNCLTETSEVMSFGVMGSKLLSSSTSLYSMTDIRTLSCFSISVGNGQLIKTGLNSYTSQTGLPVKVDMFGREINYKSTLRNALNKYLKTGTFYEIDFERQDGGIKVYDDPEIIEKTETLRDPATGEAVIDPETGKAKTKTVKKIKHHYYVHPILMEKNLSQIAEDIFFLDVDSIYDNSVSRSSSGLGEITVREAINKLSEGTQVILYGDLCGSDLYYFSNFSGEFEWPAPDNYRVTSPYGYRIHPISGKYKLHAGIDIAGPIGSPVVSAENGVVEFAGYNSSYGNYIKVRHSDAQTSLYAHLSAIGVIAGETVSRGQQIGLIGSTGNSTGPHLHFEMRINGSSTDPLPFICSDENRSDLKISN